MSTPDQTPEDRARIARLEAELQIRAAERDEQHERVRSRAQFSSRIVSAVTIILCFGLSLYMLIELFPVVALVVSPVLVLLGFFMFRVFVRFSDLEDRLERLERRLPKTQ